MGTSKDYLVEATIGSVPLDMSGPAAAGVDVLSEGYGSADFYLAGAADNTDYQLHVQENGVAAPNVSKPRGFIANLEGANPVGGLKLIARGVPLVESQKLFVSGGTGTGTLSWKRYTWGDNIA